MATYDGLSITDPPTLFGGLRLDPKHGLRRDGGSTIYYYFRRADGTRGSTTDASAVPSTACIERRSMS